MGGNGSTAISSFDRLAAINRAITTSLNFNEVLQLIVRNASQLISAERSLLLLTDEEGLLKVRATHGFDGRGIENFSGAMEESVIRELSAHLDLSGKELVTVPVMIQGSISGFLAIVSQSQLSQEEQWQLSALADQAAIALNNARLHEIETELALRQRDESLQALRESNQRISNILESLTVLYELVNRLNRTESLTQVYNAALDAIQRALRCDRASILLFNRAGMMRFRAWHGLSDEYRKAVEGHSPWQPTDRNPLPVCIQDTHKAEIDDSLKEVVEREGIRALAFIPLVYQGKLLGKFMAYYDEPHSFSSEDLQMAQAIAGQLAFGIYRKRSERERLKLLDAEREARAEAEKANQLKDEFLATLSHELRNPLNVILGYSEVLLRSQEAQNSQFLMRAAEILRRNALAQSQLVCDLLDLSRLHTGKVALNPQVASLSSIIGNAVDTVRAEAVAKNIKLSILDSEEVLFVDGDSLRLEQVVWNLLNNAVKFTPPGGSVTVQLSREDDQAVIHVRDTGQGIEPDFLPKVFEIFRQADASSSRRHSGLGIGLALVRQLVELHGGTVQVDSEGAAKGSQFTVRLPLTNEICDEQETSPRLIEDTLREVRILVVDDSEDTIEMLRHLLELEGAIVNTAMSGPEALELAASTKFDVILSDISMPEMDGFELIRRLRKIPAMSRVPVLALTGFGRAEDIKRARAEGFVSHVTKPLDVDHLVEIMRNTVSGQHKAKASS